ncbi:hypothetical protein CRENBAI_011506 [Crenichthys baileyi]|uniref:Uncharacterized protein n=1 Tax=Crenichthys baileyi TaxID=28760 RepID=A0AAV9R255_9TELE
MKQRRLWDGQSKRIEVWGVGGRLEEKQLQKPGWVTRRWGYPAGSATSVTLSRKIGGVLQALSTCPGLRQRKGDIKAGGQANAPTSGRGGRRVRIHNETVQGTGQVARDVVGHDSADRRSSAAQLRVRKSVTGTNLQQNQAQCERPSATTNWGFERKEQIKKRTQKH